MMTDFQLIHEIAHGNNNAFTELYETYRKEFVGYIRMSFKGDEDTIFHLYQDSCVALYDNIRTGKLTESNLSVKLKTYLFGIGHHKLLDLIRREQVRGKYKQNTELEVKTKKYRELPDFQQMVERDENLEIIKQAVKNITEPCNSILTLYVYEDKSNDDIALELGYSNADSAKQQKSRCWKKLIAYVKTLIG